MLRIFSTLALAAAATSWAQSPFIGTWKFDTARSRVPDEMKIQSEGGNRYTFNFGAGAETIVADGTYQPGLNGSLLSAQQVAPDTWIIQRKKDGRVELKATWKLAPDGRTLTDYYRSLSRDGSPLSLDYVYQRIGSGFGVAADWQSIKETRNTPLSLQVMAYGSNGLSFITPVQQRTENVIFDHQSHSTDGAAAGQGAELSAQQLDPHHVVITHTYKSAPTFTEDVTLSPDLKTLTITLHFAGNDKPTVMVYQKQPGP